MLVKLLRTIVTLASRFTSKLLDKAYIHQVIFAIADGANIDLQLVAFKYIGVLNCGSVRYTGELFFIQHILSNIIENNFVFFDIGANTGEYSALIRNNFPQSSIYAFEPNPIAYKRLAKHSIDLNISSFKLGLGSSSKKETLYTLPGLENSEHGSMYKEVLDKANQNHLPIKKVDFQLATLDEFCNKNKIKKIDFVKIDVEGNELSVLSGAKKLIQRGNIKIIQFEFNEMNVVSKTFLCDFYNILPEYSFYRITPRGLWKLGEYTARNEIFAFQNIIAVHTSQKHKIKLVQNYILN